MIFVLSLSYHSRVTNGQTFCEYVYNYYIVQSFYENLGVNLKQIATQIHLVVSGTEKCALQHTKSLKEEV